MVACAEVQVGGDAGNRGNGEWDLATQALYAALHVPAISGGPRRPAKSCSRVRTYR